MRTKLEKFSNRLIEKNPSLKFTLPLVVVLFFTWITISNIQEKIEKDTQELFRLSNLVITEYEIYETERDKRFAKLLKAVIYEDKDVLNIIQTKKINAEIIDSRIAYKESQLLPFKTKYEEYLKGYKVLKRDYEVLRRLKSEYDNTYNYHRKRGKSRTWTYDFIEAKQFSDFEKRFFKAYRKGLSYYDVNKFTTFNFKDTVSSKFNTTGFLKRIRDKRDWFYAQMFTYKANMSSFNKAIVNYEILKKEFFTKE